MEVPPGEYKLTIRALVKKQPRSIQAVIAVKPGETTKVDMTLPIPPP